MLKYTTVRRVSCQLGACLLVLLALGDLGCFRSVDPSKLTCDKAAACPSGYYCSVSQQKCIEGTAPGGVSSPADGSLDRDGMGAGGTVFDTGGIVTATGGAGGAPNRIDGGGDAIDAPTASGGASNADAPLAGAGGVGGGVTGGSTNLGGSAGTGSGGMAGLGSGGTAGSGSGGTPTLSTGAQCTGDAQCTLGFCVDGVCCDSRCGGQCQACAEPGSVGACTTVRSGVPRGNRTACGGTGLCQGSCDGSSGTSCKMPNMETVCQKESCSAGQHTPASYCNGTGTCPTQDSAACSSGACTTDGSGKCSGACTSTSCPTGQYCASNGNCAVKKGNGTGNTCSSATECSSGVCSMSDSVCCQTDCLGQCQTCDNSAGTCTRVSSGQPVGTRAACTNSTDTTCGGRCNGTSDGCYYPASGTSCGSGASCTVPDYVSKVTWACNSQGSCTSTAAVCPSDQACIGGGCTTKISSNGATSCQVDGQCQSGHCCSGICRDWSADSSNCGACGKVCVGGKTCSSGACGCPAGTTDCGAVGCANVNGSDASNCGACGHACPGQCSGGTCTCATQSASNLVPDGGFDGNSSEWVQQASNKYATTRASLDSAGCASSGSLLYTNTGPNTADIPIGSPCFAIAASSSYNMGAWVYIPSSAAGGIGPWPYAFVAIDWYTDTTCSSGTGASLGLGPSSGVLDAWQYIHQEGVVPPAGTKAGKFALAAYGNSAGFAQAYFDSLYFTPAPGRF